MVKMPQLSGHLDEENHLVDESLMKKLRKAGHDSICYVLSKIYFAVEDDDVKLDCRRATYYAKKMGNKLGEYKAEARKKSRRKKT